MKIVDYTESIDTPEKKMPSYLSHFCKGERVVFFDIETTGFSARNTTLYLIGVLWYEGSHIRIRQWFNEDGHCESQLLAAFEEFCRSFTMLVHFNGLGFDLPYLKQKAEWLHIAFTLDKHLNQLDIFKEIRSYKHIFCLENMKQVSIEQYLGIRRSDTNTGGELINIYRQYVAHPNEKQEQLLLLHNHDDLLGMPQISQILNYKAFFCRLSADDLDIQNISFCETDGKLTILFEYPDFAFLPNRILISKNQLFVNAMGQTAHLQIPVIRDTLKHYFSDYKNYYYLPMEDTAVHKSIAAFVEPCNRVQATKSTCYVKKTEDFIPCFSTENQDVFQYDISNTTLYQCMNTLLSDNRHDTADYILQCLKVFSYPAVKK